MTERTSCVPHFLTGGGEMGAQMRARDWSSSALGPPETWPQSLRSAVSILLPSRAQICLFWGPDLVAIYNDPYRPVLGLKHPWALGRPAREVWSEFWDDVLRPLLERVVNTGEAFWASDYPFPLERHGYPEETYFDISYDPVRDETGGVGGVFCIVSETTGRVLGERRLRTLRDVSRVAADAADTADAFRRVAGVLAENPQDLPFALLYDGARDVEAPRCAGAAGVAPLPPETWPLHDVAKTRSELILEGASLSGFLPLPSGPWPEPPRAVAVLPIIGAHAAPLGFLVAGVSPRRALDESYRDFLRLLAANTAAAVGTAGALAEERARALALAELDRAKTLFFSNVSHEFRTPLTLMIGPVEDALNDRTSELSDRQRERLDLAHRNATRLLKLVNTLLDFSRIEAGRIEASYSPVDLAAATADIASVFRSAVEKAGLRLVIDCPPGPHPIHLDREMWEKIIFNLLSNALKFTFEGEIAVEVRWSAEGAEVTVRDTGIGIAPEHIPRLFERFYRVPNVHARSHEGSGIGLSLVSELVKLHGGNVRVESEPGRGTAITIGLRAGTTHLPADRIEAPKALPATAIGGSTFVQEAQRWLPDEETADASWLPEALDALPAGRIVWADDNADMRDYVRRILAPYWTVQTFSDGLAALESALADPPDLVLADVMMPRLGGFELLERLRADQRTKAIPVILLSARAGEEARIQGLDAGADDYLVKPFSARELIARARTHLEMNRVRRELAARQREADARFRVAAKAARLGVWHADVTTWEAGGDAALMEMLGFPPDKTQLTAQDWRDVIHPDDRDAVLAAFAECAAGRGPLDAEFRVVLPDGRIRWLSSHGDLLPGDPTSPPRIVGVGRDVTEQRKLVEAQQLLVNELNHRVRNTLTTVLSLAKQTAANSDSVQAFVGAFQARILALSQAHNLLTQRNWSAVSIRDVVAATLAPHRASGSIRVEGPDCDLYPRHALALTLGLHELATNACKYGALSASAGRIEVVWDTTTADAGRVVRLLWSERGGPPVRPPERRGFGSRLIERALASDLSGDVKLEFNPSGVSCRIAFTIVDERNDDAHVH